MTNLNLRGCLFLFIAVVMFQLVGCGIVLREPDVYSAEVDFVEDVGKEVVRTGSAVIAMECECVEVEGNLYFSTRQCADLAEALVVTTARLGYHTDFMRFLGGINEERPTEKPPNIPEATTLCPPVNGGIGGTGSVDGGTQ